MNNVKYFTPNAKTHPEFAEELKNAYSQGVAIHCYDCSVTDNSLEYGKELPFFL